MKKLEKVLAIDVGGTKIYNAIINESGEIISEVEKHSTPKTFDGILELFKDIIDSHEVDMIAFAAAGAVNNENTGFIGSTGNMPEGYSGLDFQSLSDKPVFVENDANCAAWAEHRIGAAKGMKHSVMLTLGTGVGGGIIVDNKLLKGKSGSAGEMHFKMNTDRRRRCSCGAWDCYEAYASGTGLKLTAQEMSANPDITTYDVINGMEEDPAMREIFERWQNDLLAGIIGLANIFDPEAILLSGSMAQFVDLEYLTKATNEDIVTAPTQVLRASAGNYSGMIGAALLALEKLSPDSSYQPQKPSDGKKNG